MNKILQWFFNCIGPSKREPARRVKFVEGTEWTCPKCHKVLTRAKRDIHYGDLANSADWTGQAVLGLPPIQHCGYATMRRRGNVTEIHTPTGWVG